MRNQIAQVQAQAQEDALSSMRPPFLGGSFTGSQVATPLVQRNFMTPGLASKP